MRKTFALVFNARAGVARPRLLDGVLAHLKGSNADVFQVAARSSEEAAQRIREIAATHAADAVIAAGGDGTFRAIATGAAGTSLPVGFLPLGTGNVLAYEIGLKKNADFIAAYLLGDPIIPVQGSLINGEPFFLMAGAGYDARIVHQLDYQTKRLVGRAAYTAPVLRTIRHGAERFDVAVDGKPFGASWVIVTRASRYGGSFVLTRETCVGTGQMLAILIDAPSRAGLLRASVELGLGRLAAAGSRPGFVTVLPASRVVVGRQLQAPLQVDGDDAGLSPADIVAEGPVVQLVVPPAYAATLSKRHTNHLL